MKYIEIRERFYNWKIRRNRGKLLVHVFECSLIILNICNFILRSALLSYSACSRHHLCSLMHHVTLD